MKFYALFEKIFGSYAITLTTTDEKAAHEKLDASSHGGYVVMFRSEEEYKNGVVGKIVYTRDKN